jgi:undecaprenyl-diphosphatase
MLRTLALNVNNFDVLLCRKVAVITGKRFMDSLMRVVSKSGDGYLYGPLALLALAVDVRTGTRFILSGLAAFAVMILIQKVVKHLVKRERPGGTVPGIRYLVDPPDKFSFPSGHTAGSFLVAVLLGCFFQVNTFPLYLWASAVGFSRVYNGVHYPTDVIMGSVLGIASAWLGVALVM